MRSEVLKVKKIPKKNSKGVTLCNVTFNDISHFLRMLSFIKGFNKIRVETKNISKKK